MAGSPAPHRQGIAIRSYRVVFRLERRLHKIDRWRLPVPYGVPVRGLAYFVAVLVAGLLAGRLPVVGGLLAILPPPIRYLIGPFAIGFALARVQPDGRSAHGYLVSWARWRFGARQLNGFRRVPALGSVHRYTDAAVFVPDASGPRYRRGTLTGPGRIVLAYPAHAVPRGRRLTVTQTSDRPLRRRKVLTLEPDQEVVFK